MEKAIASFMKSPEQGRYEVPEVRGRVMEGGNKWRSEGMSERMRMLQMLGQMIVPRESSRHYSIFTPSHTQPFNYDKYDYDT